MCIPVLRGRLDRFMSLWVYEYLGCIHVASQKALLNCIHVVVKEVAVCGEDSGQLHQRVCGENPGKPAGPRSNIAHLMVPKSPVFLATKNSSCCHLRGTYKRHRKLCALTPADLSPAAVPVVAGKPSNGSNAVKELINTCPSVALFVLLVDRLKWS